MVNLKQLNPSRILVINIFGIGDVLFTSPCVSNLKANFPHASIDYLANKRTAPLLMNSEKLDKVFIYERDEFWNLYKSSKRQFFKRLKELYQSIKDENFDCVFDFSLNTTVSFFTWKAGIKHRIGLNYKNRSTFLTEKFPFEGFENQHVVEYYLEILEKLGLTIYSRELDLTIPEQDRHWADQFLKNHNLKEKYPIIGIIPGGGASWGKGANYRRWSHKKYAKLVDKLIEKFSAQIILLGDKSEDQLCFEVADLAHSDVVKAYGKTTLGQLAAILEKCHLVILNDGGPLHIAVAVQAKTVSIFGPVDDHVYGPYSSRGNHHVIKKNLDCQPCYRRFKMSDCHHIACLSRIEVEDVIERVDQLL